MNSCWWMLMLRLLNWTRPSKVRSIMVIVTGDPLHSRALAHSRALLFTQPCPHCSHSRAPGEQWARLCVFTLQGCVQAARLCRGSPVIVSTQNMISDGLQRVLRQGTCWFWMLLLSHLMKYNCWRHLCRSVRKLGTQGRYHLILMVSRQPIIGYEHRHLIFFRETAKGKMKKNALCNYGYEMPHGEIAAFHLHRYEVTRHLTGSRRGSFCV